MCCYTKSGFTQKELKKLRDSGKTFIIAYKELPKGATSYGFEYKIGWNKMKKPVTKYYCRRPQGLHMRPTKNCFSHARKHIVPVKIMINDIVRMGSCYSRFYSTHLGRPMYNELVANRFFVSRNDWIKANMPLSRR